MLRKINNNKKSLFLDMYEPKIISRSIVLVDNAEKGNLNELVLAPKNPFKSIDSEIALASIYKEVTGKEIIPVTPESNSVTSQYIFDDIIFECSPIPPRFIIQHNSSDESSDKLNKIFDEVLSKTAKLESVVKAVGINFELFSDNQDKNIKDNIFKSVVTEDLKSINITLTYEIEDNCKLNLTIAHAELEKKKGIYFKANFHSKITESKNLSTISKNQKKFFDTAKKKINDILSVND